MHGLPILIAAVFAASSPAPGGPGAAVESLSTVARVDSLLRVAYAGGWGSLPIGECMGRFGRSLEGIPYVSGTLEAPGPEACRIALGGLDCVTFFETCLGLARALERHPPGRRATFEDLHAEVTHTRYRGGRLTDYSSRLHYTSEWITDNVAKGVIEDVTSGLGGVRLPLAVNFMSSHPERYPALVASPGLVPAMARIEKRINAQRLTYIPKARVAAIERRLRTGDIIAIATATKGLDYSHTGMIHRGADGRARFLHASLTRGRVTLDTTIGEYLRRGPRSNLGISVLRPLAVGPGR